VINGYSRRLRHFVKLVEELTLKDVKTRLAQYLLDHCEETDSGWICPLQETKRELASFLGSTPETLSRTLRHFKDHRLIVEQKDHFVLLNKTGLQTQGS